MILSKEISEEIRKIRSDKQSQAVQDKGWLCEGTDDGLIFYNNDTDESVETSIYARIIGNNLRSTKLSEIMPFVQAECEIARLIR